MTLFLYLRLLLLQWLLNLQLLELAVGGGAVLPTPPPITIPGNEAISTPPSSQPPGTIHSLPPWLNNVSELHPDYRKVVATVGRELGPRSFGLTFTYLLADVETGKLAAKDRPRETHSFKKNGGNIEKYFSTQAQVDELYPLLAPAAVVCRSKIKEGEFHVLIIAIGDACEDMRHASVLGEGLEAWAYRVKEVMGAVTAPGRAPTSKNALDGEVLSGFMVSALTRSSSNPTCVQNGQAWGPHVANKVVQTSLCSLTASLMEREATYIFWPNFSGSIGRMHQQLGITGIERHVIGAVILGWISFCSAMKGLLGVVLFISLSWGLSFSLGSVLRYTWRLQK